MARPRITDKQREEILAQFNVGTPQHKIAELVGVSSRTVNNLCKGRNPTLVNDMRLKVNNDVIILTKLQALSKRQKEVFMEKVNDEVNIEKARLREVNRLRDKVLVMSELLINETADIIEKGKVFQSIKYNQDGTHDIIERSLIPKDIKEMAEGLDTLSVTSKVNERHAKPSVMQQAQQSNITIENKDKDVKDFIDSLNELSMLKQKQDENIIVEVKEQEAE